MPTIGLLTTDHSLRKDVEAVVIAMGATFQYCSDLDELTNAPVDLVFWYDPSFNREVLGHISVHCLRIIYLAKPEQRNDHIGGSLQRVIHPYWVVVMPWDAEEVAMIVQVVLQQSDEKLKQQWREWLKASNLPVTSRYR